MSQNEGALHTETLERCKKQVSLRCRRPDDVSGTIAVSISRAIEHDDPVVLRSQLDQAARFEILDHASVSVKKNQRSALAALDIVQANALDIDEVAGWRVVALRLPCKLPVHKRGSEEDSADANRRCELGV